MSHGQWDWEGLLHSNPQFVINLYCDTTPAQLCFIICRDLQVRCAVTSQFCGLPSCCGAVWLKLWCTHDGNVRNRPGRFFLSLSGSSYQPEQSSFFYQGSNINLKMAEINVYTFSVCWMIFEGKDCFVFVFFLTRFLFYPQFMEGIKKMFIMSVETWA